MTGAPGRSRAARWWIGALAALIVLAVAAIVHPGPFPGEVGYVRALQRLGPPIPDLAELVRNVTSTEANIIVAALPAAWLVRRRGRRGAIAVGIAVLTMVVAQPLFKEIVDRPRPDSTQVEVRAPHTSASFPSGHSMSTTAVWGTGVALALGHRRRSTAAFAAMPIVLTGLSSGVQGVHWPSDAIAGTLAGAIAAGAAVRALSAGTPAAGDGV